MKKTIILLVFVLSLVSCQHFGKKQEWTTFRGNNQRTGTIKTKALHELTNLKWKFKTEDMVSSSPAVVDGVVYFGSEDGYLYAVNKNTGQEKWKFKTEDMVSSSPAVLDGVVYFGSGDGYLYVLE